MEFQITLVRLPESLYGTSVMFHVAIELMHENQVLRTIEGNVRCAESAQRYLETIVRLADRRKMRYLIEHVEQDFMGPVFYKVPIAEMTDEHMQDLLRIVTAVEEIHFLQPRGEWVTDQDYDSFMGDSSVWYHGEDRYPRGDFVETIDQRVAEMRINDPEISPPTDVPKKYLFVPYVEETGIQDEVAVQAMVERMDRFISHVARTGDPELIMEYLSRMANDAREWRRTGERR